MVERMLRIVATNEMLLAELLLAKRISLLLLAMRRDTGRALARRKYWLRGGYS